jgi:hypothetical protein
MRGVGLHAAWLQANFCEVILSDDGATMSCAASPYAGKCRPQAAQYALHRKTLCEMIPDMILGHSIASSHLEDVTWLLITSQSDAMHHWLWHPCIQSLS